MTWDRVSLESAGTFLNFAGVRPDDPNLRRVAPSQLRGTVALYNRLADRHLVWLADEVGMGKTFVALGVVALLRHQNPDARVLFIVPSGRLQSKWKKEIALFTPVCVKDIDHRARTFQGLPARPLAEPGRLFEMAHEMAIDPDRDVIATMSSFSFGLGEDAETWNSAWRELVSIAPQLPARLPPALITDKLTFKKVYSAALNLVLPEFDLVVCDEAHNLRAGAGHGAARNLTMAAALGGRTEGLTLPWSQASSPRVARLLCLTATPVERQYDELFRQAEVFGLDRRLDLPAAVRADLNALSGGGDQDQRKEIARRYVVRRLQELHPDGVSEGLTKNQYRREWRNGAVKDYDEELQGASPRERLMVALVQKRVVELLHETKARQADGTFLPSFQMGMLSSFESFSETISGRVGKTKAAKPGAVPIPEPVYDGEQTEDPNERQGADSGIVDRICRSYRETFAASPPHPKLDQVADQLAAWAAEGEKALVFVRRVRSTEELADKVSQRLDQVLIKRVTAALPKAVLGEIQPWLTEWDRVKKDADVDRPLAQEGDDDEDPGGADSFFAWFFRGAGTEEHQVAAKLRRDTFQRPTHPWSIFFHDNYVLALFGDDPGAVSAWAMLNADPLLRALGRLFPTERGGQELKRPGERHYFEGWQAAALEVLSFDGAGIRATAARELRHRLYPEVRKGRPWAGEPRASEAWLTRQTFFTRLRVSDLADDLWPGASALTVPDVGPREVRRELLASTIRLGAPFVDLWLSAVSQLGSLTAAGAELRIPLEDVADGFIARLSGQRDKPGQTSFRELRLLAEQHQLLLDVNFSDVAKHELHALNRYFQAHLSKQSPALAMHGGSKSSQALTQFRMPGYPLVLVATDVLQEGVDLHTFCARVVHYGIAPTSSATEQRTGRVDRIGSKAHRDFQPDDGETRLQVHYPHLMDTVEPLQLRELYRRMDLFLRLVHDGLGRVELESSRISLQDGMHQERRYPAPPKDRLKTAFDVVAAGPRSDLTGGALAATSPVFRDEDRLDRLLRVLLKPLPPSRGEVRRPAGQHRWLGEVPVPPAYLHETGPRRQPVTVELRTRRDGKGAYVRLTSPVGEVEVDARGQARKLLNEQSQLVGAFLISEQHGRRRFVVVRGDVALADGQDIEARLRSCVDLIARQADKLELKFFGPGQDLGLSDWE